MEGADFIVCHINGSIFIKIQLKGRLTIDKKYNNKDIYIAFNQDNKWYLYSHDELQLKLLDKISDSQSWEKNGNYSYPCIPKNLLEYMEQYAI